MTLAAFNDLDREQAVAALLACCTAPEWAARVADARPFPSIEKLLAASDAALGPADLEAALAGHPRIGDRGASGARPPNRAGSATTSWTRSPRATLPTSSGSGGSTSSAPRAAAARTCSPI